MANKSKVIECKELTVEASLQSMPKGVWVRQVMKKSPLKLVRGNKKKASPTTPKPVSINDNSGPPTLDSWPKDLPLLIFEPELQSKFDSKTQTKARFLLLQKFSGSDPCLFCSPSMTTWMNG